jgi:hypothetical protein
VFIVSLLVTQTGCEALFGRPLTPAQIKDGTCALLEAARLACQLAELAGRPCASTPPGCTAFEKAEEDRARRSRNEPVEMVGGAEEEPCRPAKAPAAPSSSVPVPSRPSSPLQ